MVDKGLHLGLFTKREEGDESHEGLEDAGVGAHEGAVDAVQQYHQLLFVAAQLRELLQSQPKLDI